MDNERWTTCPGCGGALGALSPLPARMARVEPEALSDAKWFSLLSRIVSIVIMAAISIYVLRATHPVKGRELGRELGTIYFVFAGATVVISLLPVPWGTFRRDREWRSIREGFQVALPITAFLLGALIHLVVTCRFP